VGTVPLRIDGLGGDLCDYRDFLETDAAVIDSRREVPHGGLGLILRAWHWVASAAGFALFGLGGVLLPICVFPVLRSLPGSREQRELRCQRAVHWCFRTYLAILEAMGVIRLEVVGGEALRQPGQLVVSNHPTLLDVVFLISLMPQADCVAKQATWSNPFMRGVVTATGYLSNDLGGDLVDVCAERLASGRSLLLFPEGTRSPKGGLGPFQRGAVHVALRGEKPLRTVLLTCSPPALDRGRRWYQMPTQRLAITVDARSTLDPADLLEPGMSRGVAARKVSATLRDFYAKKLQNLDL
jgi:1-acyl-sn-glycerol-3-phosphate acyltransferase